MSSNFNDEAFRNAHKSLLPGGWTEEEVTADSMDAKEQRQKALAATATEEERAFARKLMEFLRREGHPRKDIWDSKERYDESLTAILSFLMENK